MPLIGHEVTRQPGRKLRLLALTRMGIDSESAGALKGSAPYQSSAVLVITDNQVGVSESHK